MTNAWPWLGSGRESGEPFCHGVISECRCMWKTAGSKSRGVALKSAASTSPGKGAVVRQADGRPSSTADLIANPPVLRSSVDVTVDVGWNGTCRRCPGIATASFSAPDGFACVLRCFSRAGGTDSSSLDTAWKCISAMHRLGGAKALPDDLRQTHRDRPLSQPLSHPPGSTLAPGSLSRTWVLAADAGTRCWGPRRKNRNPPSVHPVGPPSEKLQRSGAVAATIGVCRRNRNCHVDSCGRRRKKERANAKPRRETVDTAIDYVQITSGPNFRSGAVDTGSGLTSMRACADCSRGRLDAPCGGGGLFVFISEDQIAPWRG